MRILILSEHWQAALACIQSFGRRGHHLIAAYDEFPTRNARSDHVAELVHLPQTPDAHERAQELGALVEQRDIDLVIPISDDDALAVAIAAEEFSEADAFVTGPSKTIGLVRDRNASAALCRAIGVQTPKSRQVTRQTVEVASEEIGFPCFLKVTGEVASNGVFELGDLAELRKRIEKVGGQAKLQLQELVRGDFVGITGFCHDGQVMDSFGFRTDYGFSHAGTPPYAWLNDSSQARDMLEKIARALNWTGGIDLDLIEGPDGLPSILEINPRFSGTVNFALMAGHDLPAGYLAAKGENPGHAAFPPNNAALFVSLAEEGRFRKNPGSPQYARKTRRGQSLVHNGYPDDKGYSRPLRRLLREMRLEEWKLRLKRLI